AEVLGEDPPHVGLRAAGRGTVVVGEVEMVDPQIEGTAHDGAQGQRITVLAEVLPAAQRDGRQQHTGSAHTAVLGAVVTGRGGSAGIVAPALSVLRDRPPPEGRSATESLVRRRPARAP